MRFLQYSGFLLLLTGAILPVLGQDISSQARALEAKGDAREALGLFAEAAKEAPNNVVVLQAYAEFLDRHGDARARKVYAELLQKLADRGGHIEEPGRRLAILQLQAGDVAGANATLAKLPAAARVGLLEKVEPKSYRSTRQWGTIEIPGPIRSFSRMAALSPDLPEDEILSALARNVITNGYQAASATEGLEQTEYLKLVFRYMSQARELAKLKGEDQAILIESCDSAKTADLLRALGYRMRGACGADVVLETVNASRAFLTIDSGFPLADLEQALRTNRPFKYDYKSTVVPVLYGPEYWLGAKEKQQGEFIDQYLGDPQLCRLYLAMSKLDEATAEKMKAGVPVIRLKAFSHILDFFGAMFHIRNGKAVVPGGAAAESTWTDIVGAPVSEPAAFFEKLIAKDDGWLASYYDSMARVSGPVQSYLTEPGRLKRYYNAIKGKITSPGPARPVFRANTDLLLLTTRIRLEANGQAHVPGGIEVWKNLFVKHPHGKYDGKLTKAATGWKEPDDIVEALFALCRKAVENEPLKMFMMISDMNRRREKALEPPTVERLIAAFKGSSSQFLVLNETPYVSDATIVKYLNTVDSLTQIKDQGLRANVAGSFQSLVAYWQIFTRQGAIPNGKIDEALAKLCDGVGRAKNTADLFELSLVDLKGLLAATGSKEGGNLQDKMMDALAGGLTTGDENHESQTALVQEMTRVFESQRLVSLQALSDLSEHLEALGKGGKLDPSIIQRVSGRLVDVQGPRAGLSGAEKNALLFGYWSERHIDQQRKLNLRGQVEKAAGDAAKLREIRGALAPLLRDTLVGFNYAYYAPPGAQILYTNPVFVRSHDFLGLQGSGQTWKLTEVVGSGWPASAGGRLSGSLAGLAYALAEAEQNFLIPSKEQALIWGDLVPQMVQMAKVPRFWRVTPAQMQWVALHLRIADSLLAEAVLNPKLRAEVLDQLLQVSMPARAHQVDQMLAVADLKSALQNVTPTESLALATALAGKLSSDDTLVKEMKRLAAAYPNEVTPGMISARFGTPKPTLTHSFNPELLLLRTFPTLMGYSSRVMAESWESNLLYYAGLADANYLSPKQLNTMVPEWTRNTVERIFATHLEDWPALLRSLRQAGVESGKKKDGASAGGAE